MEAFKQVFTFGRDKILSGFKYVYSDINPSTLTGAIDIIVIEDKDGNFHCGPFHVRFGKMGTLKPADKIVDIHLNGVYLEDLHMKLGPAGEAYFIESVNSEKQDIDMNLEVSPFQSDDEDVERNDDKCAMERGSRAVSAENITKNLKKRVRRGTRMKSESNIKSPIEEINSINEQSYLSDNDESVENLESKLRGGYNSDGCVDQIDKEKLPDINMSWEWGNFPETKSGTNIVITKEEETENKVEINQELTDIDLTKGVNIVIPSTDVPNSSQAQQREVYLEELVGNDVTEEMKQQYLYTTIPNRAFNNKKPCKDTYQCDAGYKSDESSFPPTASISPTYPTINELKLSLCGDINVSSKISEDKFFQYLISYEEFMKEPDEILKNKDLVILLNGKYYNWSVAAPIIVSIIAFQTELPVNTISNMKTIYMSRKQQRRTWFGWGRQQPEDNTSPERKKENDSESGLGTESVKTVTKSEAVIKNTESSEIVWSLEGTNTFPDNDAVSSNKIYLKKIRLSSEEVAALDLREGRNDITFSMTTKYQGTTSCKAAIYRWKWYHKIVISDVDGTITKSDVLGHVLPILGHDWTQVGVARLYNKIYFNNYKFIYLSARAIGQSQITRNFLEDITQDSSEKLPEGPILLSPTSLFQSLHREVIEKKPEYFKIQCLQDVKSLFPSTSNPLYAGFGNRPNDVIAYKSVGIDPKRIFTVNPEGSLKNEYCQVWSTNYGSLSEIADHFFQYQFSPDHYLDIHKSSSSSHTQIKTPDGIYYYDYDLDDYSDVNYWNTPIDDHMIKEEINTKAPSNKSTNLPLTFNISSPSPLSQTPQTQLQQSTSSGQNDSNINTNNTDAIDNTDV